MYRTRSSRSRLALAVSVALAVTLGTLTAGGTAAASGSTTETTTASSGTAQEAAIALLPDSDLAGSGPTGFLTTRYDSTTSGAVYRWTRYEDGVTTVLPAGSYRGGVASDVIVKAEGTTYKLYDMATGAAPVAIDTSSLGSTARLITVAGSTLVMEVPRAGGGADVHLVDKPAGTVVDRVVPGIPTTARNHRYSVDPTGTLSIVYFVSGQPAMRAALVDISTATVVEERLLPSSNSNSFLDTSATHLAWNENTSSSTALWLAQRGQEGATRVPFSTSARLVVGFLGDDWVTYGNMLGPQSYTPNPLNALTARSLTGGRTVKLLDLVTGTTPDGNGGQLVQGATLEHGEGLYRITVDADGTPTSTLVASTGRPLAFTLTDVTIPTTVDFTLSGGDPALSWRGTGAGLGQVTIELRHTATGMRKTFTTITRRDGVVTWDGLFDDGTAAHIGGYTWRLTTEPTNGIGHKTERTGTLDVVGKPASHDFSNSTSPDLLFRSGGRLSVYDARQVLDSGRMPDLSETVVGNGWDTYDRIVTPGNLGGTVHADLLGRDKSGVLWSYAGTGKPSAPFAGRVRVGGGWGIYNELTAGSDVSGDGRRDLLATDTSGVLWLYQGTGNVNSPYRPRVKVGGGWGIYNKVTATGNIGGGPAGDLIARDKYGVDWLYLGKGDGTFAGRTRMASDWGYYTDLIAVGDADRDGRLDLVVRYLTGGDTGSLVLHPGTGDWRAPFPKSVPVYGGRQFISDGTLLF
ncbi:VCBS repeat-containing protein [Streptomyces sp. NPDC013489]|uniref:FG-GAP repeat domain-containing protein n=1 Tax=Streptomyces sp. NPDC013489 TaxID=3155606 RepID=UPI00340615D6